MEDCNLDGNPDLKPFPGGEEDLQEFGAWLKPQSRSCLGRGRSRGGARNPNLESHVGDDGQDLDMSQNGLEPPSHFPTRGGRSHILRIPNPLKLFRLLMKGHPLIVREAALFLLPVIRSTLTSTHLLCYL